MTPIKFSVVTAICVACAVPALAAKDRHGHDKGHRMAQFMAMSFENFDFNGDGQLTKEDRRASFAKRFSTFDQNDDKQLNMQEVKDGMKKSIEARYDAQIAKAREGANADTVSSDETRLAAQKTEALASVENRANAVFTLMDRNKDDAISKREARGSTRMLKKIVKRFDANDDGAVSPQEFAQAKEKIAKRMEDGKKEGKRSHRGWWGKGDDKEGEAPSSQSQS